ncbi:MAG: hypothetical protein ABL921_24430 [Pirellula sp.]
MKIQNRAGKSAKRRRGGLLIQVTLCMVAGSSIIVLAISLVHQAFRFASDSRNQSDQNRTLCLIAKQFREDLRQTTQIDVVGVDRLQSRYPDGSRSEYLIENQRISWEFTNSANLANLARRESFVLNDDATLSFQKLVEPECVVIQIATKPKFEGQPVKNLLHVVVPIQKHAASGVRPWDMSLTKETP